MDAVDLWRKVAENEVEGAKSEYEFMEKVNHLTRQRYVELTERVQDVLADMSKHQVEYGTFETYVKDIDGVCQRVEEVSLLAKELDNYSRYLAPPPQHPQQGLSTQQQPTSMAQHAPQPQQPGMFAQMASTAAGVAVGSTIGHTIGHGITSMFGGSGSSQPAEPQPQQYAQEYQQPQYVQPVQQQQQVNPCEKDFKAFTECLEANSNDIGSCQWYLDNLKACQAMASQY
ncbi:hypothetical protein BZG36_04522 [Bifiguratus adelaidae]|uniref:CHCH domain-containing protein n=1 Tax=Bifiguratus adelaidae TaxID=1938954 RepID=A0A261XX77_9FUNG|nr:hypothetical protein BZG36_04522 [Bifiguratus adelaidae]